MGKVGEMSIFGNLSSWTIFDCLNSTSDTLVAQLVKNLPAMWETWVWSLGWEDRLEKGKATHSIILAWRIPWTIWSMGSPRVGDNWETSPSPRAEEDEEDRETLESDYLEFEWARLLSGFSRVRFFATPWTVAHQAPLSTGFSRQDHWSGWPCPSPGDLPDPRIESVSPEAPASKADSLLLSHRGSPEFECSIYHLSATWSWESDLTFLNQFPLWEMRYY